MRLRIFEQLSLFIGTFNDLTNPSRATCPDSKAHKTPNDEVGKYSLKKHMRSTENDSPTQSRFSLQKLIPWRRKTNGIGFNIQIKSRKKIKSASPIRLKRADYFTKYNCVFILCAFGGGKKYLKVSPTIFRFPRRWIFNIFAHFHVIGAWLF